MVTKIGLVAYILGPHVVKKQRLKYRVTMMVRYYIMLTLFLKILNLAQQFCHFCPIFTLPKQNYVDSATTEAKSTKPSP